MQSLNSLSSAASLVLAAGAIAAAPYAQAAQAESHSQITIKAPIEKVWKLISDVKTWPKWNPAVESVEMNGEFVSGNSFVWKSKGFKVTSTLAEIVSPKRLTWTGVAFGTKAFHEWDLEATNDGVVVRTHETFDGWLPWLMTGTMQKTLDETLPKWLETIKATAEKYE